MGGKQVSALAFSNPPTATGPVIQDVPVWNRLTFEVCRTSCSYSSVTASLEKQIPSRPRKLCRTLLCAKQQSKNNATVYLLSRWSGAPPCCTSEHLALLRKHHAALPLAELLPVQLQDDQNNDRRSCNASLRAEGYGGTRIRNPLDLDECRHKTGPISACRDPRTDFSGAFRIAIEQICVDSCSNDHDSDRLHGGEDRENHVMPSMLEGEPNDDDSNEEERCCWICDDEASLRVDMSVVPTSIQTTNGVVQPVTGEPTDQWANDAEEVEVAYMY